LGVKPPCALVNAKLAGKKYFATLPNYLIINILIFALNRWEKGENKQTSPVLEPV
jgi:hypothetical protein